MSNFLESLKQRLFGQPVRLMHPKLIAADHELLLHAQDLRQKAEAVTYLDHGTAIYLLEHAKSLCDEVLKRPQNGLGSFSRQIKNDCEQDLLDREYLLYKEFSNGAKYQSIVQRYEQLVQQGHSGAQDKLAKIQRTQALHQLVSNDVETGYTSFDELCDRYNLTPTR